MEVSLLGPLVLAMGGLTLPPIPRKMQALVAYLAAKPNRVVPREWLAYLLWPDCLADTGRHRLRTGLLALRTALGPASSQFIASDADGLGLAREFVSVDLDQFARSVKSSKPDELEAGAELYRSDFLAQFPAISPAFDEWAQYQRASYAGGVTGLLTRLCRLKSEAGEHGKATELALRLLNLDRLSDEAHRVLMQVLMRAGRHASALQHYRDCVRLLQHELGVAPSPETVSLARQIEAAVNRTEHDEAIRGASREGVHLWGSPKPSIVVLPFMNIGGDRGQDYFIDGMVEEITIALSRSKWLLVASRNSANTSDPARIGRELGVRYVLTGSMRRDKERLLTTVQLVEAETGAHIWADRFNETTDDVFSLQEKVAYAVVAAIEPRLQQHAMNAVAYQPTANLNAYDKYLLGLHRLYAGGKDDLRAALDHMLSAIHEDGGFALAKAGAARVVMMRFNQGLSDDAEVQLGTSLAVEAIREGNDDAGALRSAGHAVAYLSGNRSLGLEAVQRAYALSPYSAQVCYSSGSVHYYSGHDDIAIEHLSRSLRLSPRDPEVHYIHAMLGWAHLAQGQLESALGCAERATALSPAYTTAYRVRCAALSMLGRGPEAQACALKLRELDPTFRLSKHPFPRCDDDAKRNLILHLRLVGLPE